MSQSLTIWSRTAGALAGVAVDAVRDLTVAQLDQVASGLHQRLTGQVASATSAAVAPPAVAPPAVAPPAVVPPARPSDEVQPACSTSTSAVIAGALIGVGVALLFATRRGPQHEHS